MLTSHAVAALSGSLNAANSLREVWGDDADIWNPSRFLSGGGETQTSVGVFANL